MWSYGVLRFRVLRHCGLGIGVQGFRVWHAEESVEKVWEISDIGKTFRINHCKRKYSSGHLRPLNRVALGLQLSGVGFRGIMRNHVKNALT